MPLALTPHDQNLVWIVAFVAISLVVVAGLLLQGSWARPEKGPIELPGRSFLNLTVFLKDLGASLGLDGFRKGTREILENAGFTGRLPSGRGARLEFVEVKGELCARFAVAADDAPTLVIERGYGSALDGLVPSDLGGGLRAKTDDASAGEKPGRAKRMLDEVADAARAMFHQHKALELRVGRGALEVAIPVRDLPERAYPLVQKLLERMARALDRTVIRVSVLGNEERHAIKGEGGEARCPYCFENVTGEEPDLVACECCRTVLHDECWQELGRCPVFGCAGKVPERRARPPRADRAST